MSSSKNLCYLDKQIIIFNCIPINKTLKNKFLPT